MYFNFENREDGKRFTYFSKEREVRGEKVTHTDKSVFGNLSEGIKVGEKNGQPIWENDYWSVTFCGKAYEKALQLADKTRIVAVEFNIRNKYYEPTRKSYPQITITDFDVLESSSTNVSGEGFKDIPEELSKEVPFNNENEKKA